MLEKLVLMYPKSLVNEFYKVFGPETAEKFLTIFAGATFRVPGTRDLEKAKRDLFIFEAIDPIEDMGLRKRERKRLSETYHLSTKKVRSIYRKMRRVAKLQVRLAHADQEVSAHKKPAKIKKRRKRERSRI
jgi:Mor family transcriptional regulator